MSEQSEIVRFSSAASIFGSLAGVAMAIGVPWVILVHGQSLGTPTQVTFLWVGIVSGAVISATSAFFGLVMPSQVGGQEGAHQWQKREPAERPSSTPPAR
jgi:hypothetical protein